MESRTIQDEDVNRRFQSTCKDKAKATVIRINVGGHIFQTKLQTLRQSKIGRLSRLTEDDNSYNSETGEYFFDRDPHYFRHVLQFYRTGELHIDGSHCAKTLKAEMEFWGFTDQAIGSCCWRHVCETRNKTSIYDELETLSVAWTSAYRGENPDKQITTKQRMWRFLEHPLSSVAAKIWLLLSMTLLVLSISAYAVNTLPFVKVIYLNAADRNLSSQDANDVDMAQETLFTITIVDAFCLTFFTVDLILRLYCTPNRSAFVKSFLFVCDVLFIFPGWVFIIMMLVDSYYWVCMTRTNEAIILLQVVTVTRVFRVFRLGWYFKGFRLLVYVLKASFRELLMLVLILTSGVLFYGFLIYAAEVATNDSFNNAFQGFWWAVITMSTVGYGQYYPTTVAGYIIGAACAVSGIIIISMPIPIITNNFKLYYRFRERGKYSKKCRDIGRVATLSESSSW